MLASMLPRRPRLLLLPPFRFRVCSPAASSEPRNLSLSTRYGPGRVQPVGITIPGRCVLPARLAPLLLFPVPRHTQGKREMCRTGAGRVISSLGNCPRWLPACTLVQLSRVPRTLSLALSASLY